MATVQRMEEGLVLVIADGEGHAWHDVLGELDETVEVRQLAECVALCERSEARLMIIDCGCEADEGLRLLCHAKQCRPDLPVIFVTEASSEDIVTRAFKHGAREYFRKPLEPAEFRAAAGKILEFKRANPGKPRSAALAELAPPRLPPNLSEQLLRAIRFMEQNLAKPVSLEEIAGEACMSKYHFCHLFTKQFGVSPIQFMLKMRIHQAALLLRSTRFAITRVAIWAGYNDLSEFTRQFKKVTGFTPSAYRKMARAQD
jgi:AraC-like DNA-binding protein